MYLHIWTTWVGISNSLIFYLFFFFYNQFSKHEPKPKSKVINSQNIGLMAQLKIWKQSTDLDIHYLSLLAKYTTFVFLV